MWLSLQLAWRFRSSKRQNGFISFISASSTMGIALGCFVLILLLSVMNGFERELKSRLLSVIPHAEIWSFKSDGMENWQQVLSDVKQDNRVKHAEPYAKATGMLQKGKTMKAVELTALDPEYSAGNSLISIIDDEQWQRFVAEPNAILLGAGAMEKLNVQIGQSVQLLLPQLSNDLSLKAPKTLWLEVQGEIKIGGELDNHIGIFHLQKAAQTLGISTGAQGIRFQFHDPFVAKQAVRELGYQINQPSYLSNWTLTQGNLYQDIQLVRVVVYLALILVITVACFNIVSTLVMAVNEKQSEIAMLKTMGAEDAQIIRVFMLQGLINGISGTCIGVIMGVLFALNLSGIATFFERVSGVRFLSGDIYFINFLPSELNWHEVAITAVIALILSFIATIYPARKAARINPAQVL